MKTIQLMLRIILMMVLIDGSYIYAQTPSSNQNYIMQSQVKVSGKTSESQLSSLTPAQVSRQINYFDGLGRSVQRVNWKSSPDGYDLVSPVVYDSVGRVLKEYLHYKAGSDDLSFKTSAAAAAVSYYQGSHTGVVQTSYPFSEYVYERSAIDRLLEKGSPGADWQPQSGHTVKSDYLFNTAQGGNYPVRIFKAIPTGSQNHERQLYEGGWYAANSLSVNVTKDENWTSGKGGTVERYSDNAGKVLLKRKWKTGSEALSTYYVYDDFDRLCFVLAPPVEPDNGSITQDELDHYCRQIRYDGKGREIEKKMPGKGWEEYVYNALDQVVLTRDGNLQAAAKWIFTKYDVLGRTIISGLISSNSSRATWQATIDGQSVLYENEDAGNSSGTGTGYSNLTQPFHNIVSDYHLINYYDDYIFYGNSSTYDPTVSASSLTKGLMTGMKVNVLGTSTMLISLKYYDDEGQLIESVSQNHLSGLERNVLTYNFAGDVVTKVLSHSSSSGNVVVTNNYEYDNSGRLFRTKQRTGAVNSPEVILSELGYNDLGQLTSKKYHSENNGSSFLLDPVTYAYNERSWLTNSSSSLFAMQLKYQNGTTPQYNGNISNQLWGPGSLSKTYTYNYDQLNQLTSGTSSSASETNIVYDKGGNISSLTRDGNTFSYNYTYGGKDGYKLASVTGSGLAGQAYQYDANGNATKDGSRNIDISYNVLDLPATVTGTGLNVSYTYLATGEKIRKYNQVTGTTTDYIGELIYENSSLKTVGTDEGLARNNGGTYSYEYALVDYQNNTRVTFFKDPVTGLLTQLQTEDYYPYGLRIPPGSLPSNYTNYLYSGKELQEEFNEYDFGARFYDPLIGRWNVMDPANQFDDLTPYSGIGNNPIVYNDPDGRFIPILVGALIGGAINLGVKIAQGKIHSLGDGLSAFGIGAIAGGVATFTGGAALAGSGFVSTSIGGGIVSGLAMSATQGAIQGVGNAIRFGDPFSFKDLAVGTLIGGVTGGMIGGISAKAGTNIWTGQVKGTDPYLPITQKMIDDATKAGNIIEIKAAANEVRNTITRTESVTGHIFRDAQGHVNPSTVTSQNRFIKLFESVGNNTNNLNSNILTNFQRNSGGFQGYSQIFRNGKQVWVQTFNGKIINAGINLSPK